MEQIMENKYWDKKYPTHIEVPEDYWVYSHDVEYIESN